ncbi:Protein kinase-like domain [Pseudocohnilembus persalinus]|uniref:Casein kinase I n=1 Tax=Pseudocohnilembus persalinus TaxID=266149 RepID=A0A0V0QH35_PSEPJ|nr:Protein kinase-like domain [Pseudocohnilembus persalinus]|eukprot:KRX01464.1 Protein kinase-like domain [Pseudocohnilembus persalinus]
MLPKISQNLKSTSCKQEKQAKTSFQPQNDQKNQLENLKNTTINNKQVIKQVTNKSQESQCSTSMIEIKPSLLYQQDDKNRGKNIKQTKIDSQQSNIKSQYSNQSIQNCTDNRQNELQKIENIHESELQLQSEDNIQNIQQDEYYAVKIEDYKLQKLQQTNKNKLIYSSLKQEIKILKKLKGKIGFPQIQGYELNTNEGILVMDFMSSSISDLMKQQMEIDTFDIEEEAGFSLQTVLQIGIQCLERLECLHDIGYIHRDIKPDNLMIGNDQFSQNIIHLIDFGISKSYLDKNGNHVPFSKHKQFSGTKRYSSIAADAGQEQGRKDDLESLGYTIIELVSGKLPCQINLKQDAIKGDEQPLDIQIENFKNTIVNKFDAQDFLNLPFITPKKPCPQIQNLESYISLKNLKKQISTSNLILQQVNQQQFMQKLQQNEQESEDLQQQQKNYTKNLDLNLNLYMSNYQRQKKSQNDMNDSENSEIQFDNFYEDEQDIPVENPKIISRLSAMNSQFSVDKKKISIIENQIISQQMAL